MIEIGCCGAYCKTCMEYPMRCKGCKNGYEAGERDLKKAKCKMKVCCLTRGYACCADCPELQTCQTIQAFFQKGYKYQKYQQTVAFIVEQGYPAFCKAAERWKRAYGKLPHAQREKEAPGAENA